MSDLLNRQVALVLRNGMFPTLPQDVQELFAQAPNELLGPGPNIQVGHLSEMGAGVEFPIITVTSEGALEGLTRGTYRHLTMEIDYWVQGQNLSARRVVALLYEYSRKFLQDQNFSGNGMSIQRCYEIRASDILFQPPEKLYHISNGYRVEAISAAWY